ncbi:MAG: type I restriction-modification system subunit M [Candidatus Pacebacteria bacterium]|nr:type I restriction-modification system subunit M [Candidatus Paceibacterota bacterium]
MRSLWEAAVNLRGSIEPADYKRYVLPLIFLRFLSLRFEKRRKELDTLMHDPSSDYYTTDSEVAKDILNDEDEYRAAGAFVVPEEARWSNIVKIAQADDLKIRLDRILELLEKTYPNELRGLLPRIYAGSNLDRDNLAGLINLFSRDVFTYDHGGEDIIGRVYEYFIGEFANSEGKRGGEYFTPASIVKVLVAMLEPTEGVVYDPCCGSGGMFVQSDSFTHHSGELSFVGQESKDFTYRLCRMNLFIHGINGNIKLGNTYVDDKHAAMKADYVIANPPFNDGSKSEAGWGADKVPDKDARLSIPGSKHRFTLSPRNANTMWILHFLHHLAAGGRAGFVMATGELSSMHTARLEVRQALVERNHVDCIVQLTGQLFANTQIPCSLWFLSKGRDGSSGERERNGEVLFIDGRHLGTLIPGSRKQKQLSPDEIEKIAAAYRKFRTSGTPEEQPGFCKVATLDEIAEHRFVLTPGRYVGAYNGDEEDEPFKERMPELLSKLKQHFEESDRLQAAIAESLQEFGYGE